MIGQCLQSEQGLNPDVALQQFGRAAKEFDPRSIAPVDCDLLETELSKLDSQSQEYEAEVRRSLRETTLLEALFVEYRQALELLHAMRSHSPRSDRPQPGVDRLAERVDALAPLVAQKRAEQDIAEAWGRLLRHHVRVLRYKLNPSPSQENDETGRGPADPARSERIVAPLRHLCAALECLNQKAAEARANGAAIQFTTLLTNIEQLAKDPTVASAVGLIRGSANSKNNAGPTIPGDATPSSQELRLAAG